MLKKDELSNPNSCLNRADENEWLFVLRANDPIAPTLVREWALRYREYKYKEKGNDQLNDKESAKFREALDTSLAMMDWRRVKDAAL